ncbi:MAG: serine/threonine protein kinase [Pseudanabaena sp.]|nr:MAG: serine/threonine protein kinase [Pseudanabaena sp.]
MIGQLLDGRYRIVSKLGEGGFGHTYLAHDTRIPDEPLCVVKHLKPASNDQEYLRIASRLFTSEAQILAKLGNHDRLPRLLAYFDQAGEFYLVEEFVEGRSLEAELAQGRRLSDTQVTEMLDDLLSILEYVHSNGVIHRDIKPDNIIRRKSDNKLVLIDFGAIKQIQNQINQEAKTMATVAIGTAGYMPSEQAQGKPRPSSDLYAIGIIGIQALTGLNPRDLQEDYQTGELIWQHLLPNRSGVIDIISKMTRYHYKDRYESATDVRQAIARLSSSNQHSLPTVNITNGSQTTIVSVNSAATSPNHNVTNVPPTEITPLAPPPPQLQANILPTVVKSTDHLTQQATVQSPISQKGKNENGKIWWLLWVGAFSVAVAIGAVMATRSPKNLSVANTPNSLPQANAPSPVETEAPTPEAIITEEPDNTPDPVEPSLAPNPQPPAEEIAAFSEDEAVDIVTELVASKGVMFAPPFDRNLLAELTTDEAYAKRKGAIDWLQSNNAFYEYGEFSVVRAGAFGFQDGQANLTVEIFESPTLYVNGKVDPAQSQPSKGKYVCVFRFEDGKWKIASLTKI